MGTGSGDRPEPARPATAEAAADGDVVAAKGAAEEVLFLRPLLEGARDERAAELPWRVLIEVRGAVVPVVTAAATAATAAMQPDAKLGT